MSRQPRPAGPVGTRVRVDRHHARHRLGRDRPRLVAAHRVAHVAGGRTRRTAAGPAVPRRVSARRFSYNYRGNDDGDGA